MHVVTVFFEVKESAAAEFANALLAQAKNSLAREEACRVFDVAEEKAGGNRFFLYELYDSEADFQSHLQTPHFLAFNEYAAPLTIKKEVQTYRLTSPAPDSSGC